MKWPVLDEAGVFSAKALLAWVHHRKCLCGCGQETKHLRGRKEGGHSYFTNKCWPVLARTYNLRPRPTAPVRRDPVWLEAVRKENDNRLCTVEDTEWYVYLVNLECETKGLSYRAWAREHGFPQDYVYGLNRAARYKGRITKYNAARILKALGERVPEELQRRYEGRVKQTRKRTQAKRSHRRKVS